MGFNIPLYYYIKLTGLKEFKKILSALIII